MIQKQGELAPYLLNSLCLTLSGNMLKRLKKILYLCVYEATKTKGFRGCF